MQPRVMPEWLTVKELMTLTGLGRTKCYELIASGELEAIKAGRAVRVSRASFEEWTRRRRYLDVVVGEGSRGSFGTRPGRKNKNRV